MERKRKSWWHYIYLLGLDAPLIAVLWLFLFAENWRVNYHPWEAYVALGLVVWTIRIGAKLLQSAMAGESSDLRVMHRKWLGRLTIVTGISAIILTVLNFPISGYVYLLVGAILVIGYFALALFSSAPEGEIPYIKHAIGGVAFAFGTGLMAHVYLPNLGVRELLFTREFICFSVLCVIASVAVELWTSADRGDDKESAFQDELILSLPLTLLGAFSLVFAVQLESMIARPFFYGILTGAALLQVLNRTHHRFSPLDVKVLTSACLLIPVIIFLAYEMSH